MKRRIITLLVAAQLLGCVPLQRLTADDHREALRLVDEGTILLRAGQFDSADAAFEVAYLINGTAAALDGRGCVAFLRGDLARAEELFVAAFNADLSYNNSLANLALVREVQGRREEALQLYREAVAVEPRNVPARNNFAVFLAETGLDSAAGVRTELLRAQALGSHPIVEQNIDNNG